MQVQGSHGNRGNILEHPPPQPGPLQLCLSPGRAPSSLSLRKPENEEESWQGRSLASPPAKSVHTLTHRQLTKASFFSFQSICRPLSPIPLQLGLQHPLWSLQSVLHLAEGPPCIWVLVSFLSCLQHTLTIGIAEAQLRFSPSDTMKRASPRPRPPPPPAPPQLPFLTDRIDRDENDFITLLMVWGVCVGGGIGQQTLLSEP